MWSLRSHSEGLGLGWLGLPRVFLGRHNSACNTHVLFFSIPGCETSIADWGSVQLKYQGSLFSWNFGVSEPSNKETVFMDGKCIPGYERGTSTAWCGIRREEMVVTCYLWPDGYVYGYTIAVPGCVPAIRIGTCGASWCIALTTDRVPSVSIVP